MDAPNPDVPQWRVLREEYRRTRLGLRIARYRDQRGMTQQQVADVIGCSREYVCMLENGKRSLDRHSILELVAEALRVDVSALLTPPHPLAAQEARVKDDSPAVTLLVLQMRDLSIAPSRGVHGERVLVLSDGVSRVELTSEPAEFVKLCRNTVVRMAGALDGFLHGELPTPAEGN